jgi:molybdopterin-binding protein
MRLSARNHLHGTIEAVDHGAVTTNGRIRIADDLVLTSSITLDAADDLGLKTGDEVTAIIKSSDVIIGIAR